MRLAEQLGGLTVLELAERMTAEEFVLWEAEYRLRDEERRDAELEARARRKAHG
jgi:hypothetical protein